MPPLFLTPTSIEYAAVKKTVPGNVQLRQCGVGEHQAGLFCQSLPELPTCLVLIGWGGGLVPNLAVGDIVCANLALREGLPALPCTPINRNVGMGLFLPSPSGRGQGEGSSPVPNDILREEKSPHPGPLPEGEGRKIAPLPIPRVHTGPILTAPQALLIPAEKRQAHQASGALAVEMEAYPIAAWAHQHNIPFTHLRVISDRWDESLPDLGAGLDASGRVHFLPLLRQLALHPTLIHALWHLNQRIQSLNPILKTLASKAAFILKSE